MSLYKPCILVMHALHLPFQYLKHLTIRGGVMLNGVRACVCSRARVLAPVCMSCISMISMWLCGTG